MFRFINVTKVYEKTEALDGLNLTIPHGKTTVLIGPSGCGKSTLLKLCIGLIRPERGEIFFQNEPLPSDRKLREIRKKMGYMIQSGGLFPHKTARQNVLIMAEYAGMERAASEKRLLELCELTAFPKSGLDRYPVELSGGQNQRVSLMRSLLLDPAALLLDEPLGALDPMIRSDLQSDLRTIFQTLKKTVIMVTHDIGEAVYFGDLIVLMRKGRIVQSGSPTDLLHHPTDPFVTKFVNAQRSPLEAFEETR